MKSGEKNDEGGNMNLKRYRHTIPVLFGILLLSLSVPSTGFAFTFELGEGVNAHWDTTLKYSTAYRVAKREPALVSPANANADDGDRDFSRRLTSNRFDILSEADIIYKGYGARVSGAGWYDRVYNTSTSNDSPFTYNAASVTNDHFTEATKIIMGRDAELLDAFVFGSGNTIGSAELPYDFRVGRYTLMWGESLFFGSNGVAGGQAPIDVIKALGSPGSQTKEILMPVTQVSGSIKVANLVKLMAFYQLEWRQTRLPAAGSYFSSADFLGNGGERVLLPDFGSFPFLGNLNHGPDIKPPNSGQFGVGTMWSLGDTSVGLYFVQFDSKTPSIYFKPLENMYQIAYQQDIRIYGASYSSQIAGMSVGAEVGYRTNQNFIQGNPFVVGNVDAKDNPGFPVGRSAHAQLSVIAYPGPNIICDANPIAFETMFARRLSIEKNAVNFDTTKTRDFFAASATSTPTWFNAFPGVNLTLPLSLAYNYSGNSSFDGSKKGAGTFSVGGAASIYSRWNVNLKYTNFFGGSGRQSLTDRDNVSFFVTYVI